MDGNTPSESLGRGLTLPTVFEMVLATSFPDGRPNNLMENN
jgi:hypothetical protein